jgi:hypothetical protein
VAKTRTLAPDTTTAVVCQGDPRFSIARHPYASPLDSYKCLVAIRLRINALRITQFRSHPEQVRTGLRIASGSADVVAARKNSATEAVESRGDTQPATVAARF